MVLLHVFLFAAITSATCYEASLAHPLPDLDPYDPALKRAFASIDSALTAIAAAPEFESTSFSLEVTSSKKSLWSRHHTASERNTSRHDISKVNGEALYRIASITKTLTVLSLLYQHEAGNLSLDDSVNMYIKELKQKQVGTLPWKDITLRSLASQLSGLPRDFAQGDFLNFANSGLPDPLDVGLPPVSRTGLLDCDEYSPNFEKPCTANDLLNTVKSQRPLYAPNMKSTYSNIAFELLGLVIARVTNQTYESYITDAIFRPLEMTKSTFSLPPDNLGVIPLEPHYWDYDAGVQNPTGGIYSSTTDLSKFLRYVLNHYNAIATGVNWFNPVSSSGGLNSFYGMPWEILQTDRILSDSRRTVRFINKLGSLPGYSSMIAMVPDYDIGITILVGGNSELLGKILDTTSARIVRAAEEIAVRQLSERYAGTYISNNHTLNSSISVTADSRGLVIERFISNGTDVLAAIYPYPQPPFYVQLVPTLLFKDENEQRGELWRFIKSAKRKKDENSIWEDFCSANIDEAGYAEVAFNEVVFWGKGKDDKFGTVELSAFKVNLTRADDHKRDASEQEVLEL